MLISYERRDNGEGCVEKGVIESRGFRFYSYTKNLKEKRIVGKGIIKVKACIEIDEGYIIFTKDQTPKTEEALHNLYIAMLNRVASKGNIDLNFIVGKPQFVDKDIFIEKLSILHSPNDTV